MTQLTLGSCQEPPLPVTSSIMALHLKAVSLVVSPLSLGYRQTANYSLTSGSLRSRARSGSQKSASSLPQSPAQSVQHRTSAGIVWESCWSWLLASLNYIRAAVAALVGLHQSVHRSRLQFLILDSTWYLQCGRKRWISKRCNIDNAAILNQSLTRFWRRSTKMTCALMETCLISH